MPPFFVLLLSPILIVQGRLINHSHEAFRSKATCTVGGLAELHCILCQFTQAEAEYAETIDIYRNLVMNDSVWNNELATNLSKLAYCHWVQGKVFEASKYINEALPLAPDDAEGLDAIGVSLVPMDRFDEALSLYQRILASNSHFFKNGDSDFLLALKAKHLNNV